MQPQPTVVHASALAAMLALALAVPSAHAQSRVQYGRITNVTATTVTDSTARNVGTLVGGGIGLATGSGQSGSNRALRTVGGAAAGRGAGGGAQRASATNRMLLNCPCSTATQSPTRLPA